MKKVNLFFSAVALGAVVLAGASVTEAAVYCGCEGKVSYMYSYGSTSGSTAPYQYVYIQPRHTGLSSYYCYGYISSTTMPTFGNQLAMAASGQDTVYVQGYNSSSTATSCETDSARWLGTVRFVSMRPHM